METNQTAKLWSAIMFIVLGIILLLQEFFPTISFEDFWPVLLIISGLILIFDNWGSTVKNVSDNEKTDIINENKVEQ